MPVSDNQLHAFTRFETNPATMRLLSANVCLAESWASVLMRTDPNSSSHLDALCNYANEGACLMRLSAELSVCDCDPGRCFILQFNHTTNTHRGGLQSKPWWVIITLCHLFKGCSAKLFIISGTLLCFIDVKYVQRCWISQRCHCENCDSLYLYVSFSRLICFHN